MSIDLRDVDYNDDYLNVSSSYETDTNIQCMSLGTLNVDYLKSH